jgi:hypothetical protein
MRYQQVPIDRNAGEVPMPKARRIVGVGRRGFLGHGISVARMMIIGTKPGALSFSPEG